MNSAELEKIYDLHSAVIYGLIIRIFPNKDEAEALLIKIFRQISNEEFTAYASRLGFAKLFLIGLQEVKKIGSDKMMPLEQFPLLQKLLIANVSTEMYCAQNKLSREVLMKMVQLEVSFLRQSTVI